MLLVAGCSRQQKDSGSSAEPYLPDASSVTFDITSSAESTDVQSWSATYHHAGKIARFTIELERDRESIGHGMTFGKGRFRSQAGSDASIFLERLKTALEAKRAPKKVTKVARLPFDFVVLGEQLSRSSNGFSGEPRGDWIAVKLFLADGEAEVYTNLNPAIGKAEFSIKDSDYGDAVLAELAKVL
ncbi:MAG: hypothetical protein L0Z53_07800 [Acidobacteriales bacterium]|nr:hypothetical protein [Terriglobales bacterium]